MKTKAMATRILMIGEMLLRLKQLRNAAGLNEVTL